MNKIKEDQLEKLVALNRDLRYLKDSIADVEIQISRAKAQMESAEVAKKEFIERIEGVAKDLQSFQHELSEEYGNITVNLQTGEYKNG
jgi:chromosome segregation ATPase